MKKEFFVLDDLPLKNKTVLVRVDINSPVDPGSGRLLSHARIKSHVRTIERLEESKVVILGHQSKPGKADYISLEAHANSLQSYLKRPVKFIDELLGQRVIKTIEKMVPGEVLLLENVRFFAEEVVLNQAPIETQKHSHIVSNLSKVADFFVNDAFAAAHRAQPSLIGFTEVLPSAAGLVMEKELNALDKVLRSKEHPCVAVLGGAKVKDSLSVAENMLKNKITDEILTTGLVANIFLVASGHDLGKVNTTFLESEFQDLHELIQKTKILLKKYKKNIVMPDDLIGNNNGEREVLFLETLPSKFPIYDVGLETVVKYSNILKDSKIIIANGPAGVFEIDEFSFGTNEIFSAIASSKAFSVIGGGESNTVVDKLGLTEDIDHISTGGGACINYLAGRKLPAVEALKNSKKLFEKKINKKKEK